MLFSYEVFLWRVPIVLTTNNWRLDDLTEEQRQWLRVNCVVVHVADPVYETQAQAPAPKRLRA